MLVMGKNHSSHVLTLLQLPPEMHNEKDKPETSHSCKRGGYSTNRNCSYDLEPTSIPLENPTAPFSLTCTVLMGKTGDIYCLRTCTQKNVCAKSLHDTLAGLQRTTLHFTSSCSANTAHHEPSQTPWQTAWQKEKTATCRQGI